jgi:hypothetical protein
MRQGKLTKKDNIEYVKGSENLADAMLDSEKPGSGIPITEDDSKSRKVNKGELKKKLERGYI